MIQGILRWHALFNIRSTPYVLQSSFTVLRQITANSGYPHILVKRVHKRILRTEYLASMTHWIWIPIRQRCVEIRHGSVGKGKEAQFDLTKKSYPPSRLLRVRDVSLWNRLCGCGPGTGDWESRLDTAAGPHELKILNFFQSSRNPHMLKSCEISLSMTKALFVLIFLNTAVRNTAIENQQNTADRPCFLCGVLCNAVHVQIK